ncbi:Uncharacterized protein OS=Sphingobacterium paucimobilis HER1398 GN=M472_01715 PE=4 SV=1 [Gemmataceae bacterium]|nr:Uncharacterized protein OS=Sphingobacterium paucimobilis HER1398 GN=M472_01715 PE=4 SV=1 [Gemmataceae bacterium]VTU00534.1 Uncharacterized protein OS=Sphingobacterium paucimobilis HER1398 GN=M472_01715 PE=4 SV=1 [Gemmataceae bacterium]
MDEQLVALFNRHVGTAFDRQLRFEGFLAKRDAGEEWEYDHETATLAFGTLKFEAPLVGSHAHNNHSWLWAWSNKHIKLTLTNRALGDAVRATWHHLSIHALGGPGFALEPVLGDVLTESAVHIFGVILTRELGYDAYYVTPYEGGEGLVLIRDERLKFTEKHPLVRIVTMFPLLPRGMPVPDHKAALTAYARDYGLTVTEQDGTLKITDGKDELTATFDGMGRVATLEGIAVPEPEPPAKPAKKKAPVKKKSAAKKMPAAKKAKTAAKPMPAAKKPAKPAAKKAKVAAKPVAAKKPAAKAAGAKKPVKKKPAGKK